jgi:membrane protein DedA with SNARE-associated domain
MQQFLETLVAHGYLILFVWVLLCQVGIPLPATPLLLAAGALAGTGRMNLGLCILLSTFASLLGDLAWYWLGRHRGRRVLGLLCRLSLEPDSCVRNTELSFVRHRVLSLLFGKFVPGIGTMVPPMAGMFGTSHARFLVFDTASSLMWSSALLLPGYVFADQLERIAERAALTGQWLLLSFVAVVVLWLLIRLIRRRAFLRGLRVARISPEQLHDLLQSGAELALIDLRSAADFELDPRVIPGARRIDVELLEHEHGAIPRDREIVLYCT